MTIFLRSALLAFAFILLLVQIFETVSNIQARPIDNTQYTYILERLSAFFTALTLPVLCIWAGHNLKPLKNVKDIYLQKALTIFLMLLTLAFAFNLANSFKTFAPYSPSSAGINTRTTLLFMSWHIYSLADIAIITFALYQTKQKTSKFLLSSESGKND